MVVIIIGYIVFIFGFYLLDLINNDVSIFKYMIYCNIKELRIWKKKENDVFLLIGDLGSKG